MKKSNKRKSELLFWVISILLFIVANICTIILNLMLNNIENVHIPLVIIFITFIVVITLHYIKDNDSEDN